MIQKLIYNNKKAIKKTHRFASVEVNTLKIYEYNQNYL